MCEEINKYYNPYGLPISGDRVAKCDYCGKEVYLPYRCKYCGGVFCVEHHLPENHACPNLKRGEWRPMYLPSKYSTRYEFYSEEELTRRKRRIHLFTIGEVRDLLLAIGAISIVYMTYALSVFSLLATIYALIAVLIAFFVHEMAHRFTAIGLGYKARFVASMEGLILTLVSALLPFKILAPGYVAISGRYGGKLKDLGLIALAGPLSNVLVAILAMVIPFSPILKHFIILVNIDIAMFNLLPFAILDGNKIFRWSKTVWLVVFLSAALLWLFIRWL